MYNEFDRLLLSKIDSAQAGIQHLAAGTNTPDSLMASALSEINANLSTISSQAQRSFLGVSWDILLPALISILVFVCGYLLNAWLSHRKKQESRALVRNTIITWTDANDDPLRKFIQTTKDLAKNIKDSTDLSPQGFSPQHLTLDIISQFSIDRLSDALVIGLSRKIDRAEKGMQLNNYISSISYLIRIEKAVLDTYDQYQSATIDLTSKWDEKWHTLLSNFQMNESRLKMTPKTPEHVFYSKLFDVLRSQFKAGCSDINRKEAVKELEQVFLYTPAVITEAQFNTCNVFNDLSIVMTKIEALKQYGETFANAAVGFEKGVEKLKNSVDFYRQHDVKFWA